MNSCTPPYIGFEIEFGHFAELFMGEDTTWVAAEALTRAHHELFGCVKTDWASLVNEFDADGFRSYSDHAHHEASGPLVASAADFVLLLRLARERVKRCKAHAERSVGPLRVFLANTNRAGVAWGSHVNFHIPRAVFADWVEKEWRPLFGQWLPFLASSPLLFGAGKLGAENGAPPAAYQLSQRSDFMDKVIGLDTVHSKSLINSRDEALSRRDSFARLHCIAFDHCQAEFANFVKAGAAQLLVSMLVEGFPLPDLALQDPLRAMAQVSRDMQFTCPLQLANGKTITARALQYRLAEACGDAIVHGAAACLVPHDRAIVGLWVQALDALANGRPGASRRLDWRARFELLRRLRAAGADGQALAAADIAFGEVGGAFEALEATGAVDRLEDFLRSPGAQTVSIAPRDEARGRLLILFGDRVVAADWHWLVVRGAGDTLWEITLDDPVDSGALLRSVSSSSSWRRCLRRLEQLGVARKGLVEVVPTMVVGRELQEG